MKPFLQPFLFLAVISFALVFVAFRSFSAWHTAQASVADARSMLSQTETAVVNAGARIAAERREEAPSESYLRPWLPEVAATTNIADTNAVLTEIARNHNLYLTERSTPDLPYKWAGQDLPKGSVRVYQQAANGDSISNILTFFAEVENRFPLARIEDVDIAASGTSVRAYFELILPVFLQEKVQNTIQGAATHE